MFNYTQVISYTLKYGTSLVFSFVFLILFFHAKYTFADNLQDIKKLIGKHDAILVTDHKGTILVSKNAEKNLIPASTLKILTSLVAVNYLGKDYRFPTEFYMDRESNLTIKGYGDPLLISEVIREISRNFGRKVRRIRDIVLDDTYFRQPILIPGRSESTEPYDAPNGALCVNFNTVNYKRLSDGTYISAEPQTPLLPYVLGKIETAEIDNGRITFSSDNNEILLYAGHIFHYFFNKEGIEITGKIRPGRVDDKNDRLVYTYTSLFSMDDLISKLLYYSNNYIANQVLIAAGAKSSGPPGTLEKGVHAAGTYTKKLLKTDNFRIVEGSGISRKNRFSARMMHRMLEEFQPYHGCMRSNGNEFYKTGTLNGISTRAGFIKSREGFLYRYTVMINTPGKSTKSIMEKLLKELN